MMSSAIAATSSAADRPAIKPSLNADRADVTTVPTPSAIRPAGRGRRMLGWLDDAVLLLVLGLAFPLAILVVGTPIALAVRLLIELGRRWY
jgi:hypothetical protein